MNLHWTLKIPAPKNKTNLLETEASLYAYENVYRVCFKNTKQVYYFEIPTDPKDTASSLKELALAYFSANRNILDVAKCVRCNKWDVQKGQFCERCNKAIAEVDLETTPLTILDIET